MVSLMKSTWISCSTQKYNINCVDLRISIEFQLRALSERKSLLRAESSLQDITTCTIHVMCSWYKLFFAKMNNSLKKYCCFLQTCYFASKVFWSQVSLPYNSSFNFMHMFRMHFVKDCAMLDSPYLLYIYPVMPCTVFMV